MNKIEEKERFVQCMKDSYPPGTRLMLISMDDPYAPMVNMMSVVHTTTTAVNLTRSVARATGK